MTSVESQLVDQPDDSLGDLLLTLSTTARDRLRRVLILEQVDRDAIATELLRCGDPNGDGWAAVIDILTTMDPDERRDLVRLIAEINAHEDWDGPYESGGSSQGRWGMGLP